MHQIRLYSRVLVALGLLIVTADIDPAAAQARFAMPGRADKFAEKNLAEQQEKLKALSPVTDAVLQDPPAADWLNWRRTYNGWGYSPLDQIDRDNVGDLRLAWSWALDAGANTNTPLVHDGVMFVQHHSDKIEALDAATGELLWSYNRRYRNDDIQTYHKKTIALYKDMVIAATADLNLVALDMKTGDVVWEHAVADWQDDYMFASGPIVADGVIIIGVSGCGGGQPGGCFITGHDAETGEELWRFHTIARPGEPGGNTWNGLPLEKRFGGSVWNPGTYDPELGLVYFGIAQPYPWNAELRGTAVESEEPGVTNDLLYTNSTVALDPKTGELVWHYQHLSNDSWDMDYAFERQIIEMPVDGEMRKLVVTSGKLAIIEALDAETGEFVFAKDMGLQDLVTDVDPDTGAKTVDRSKLPEPGETVTFCPHGGGIRNWMAPGYDPTKRVQYLPLLATCAEYTPYPMGEDESYSGGGMVRWRVLPPKDNPDGKVAEIRAFDFDTQSAAWRYRERAPQMTASLPTAGGVVFEGALDRYFRALDSETGTVLWETRLSDVPNSFPVTYEADGRQYVAVMTGAGSPSSMSWSGLLPDIHIPSADSGAVWVFSLPE